MILPDSPPPPDWVELGAKPNRGLDLTGLRLPVQSIGNDLLNGITTITPSVRYVSFYSWIVLSYLNARQRDNWGAFRSFAEPVETAIAIGNMLRNRQVTGVVGARGATRIVDEKTDPAPLMALVEQLAVNNYFNPCQQLKFLLAPTLQVPGLSTERGRPLAEFIGRSVEKTHLGHRVSSGELIAQATLSDLQELGQVTYLAGISEEEAGLLTDGIIPAVPSGDNEIRRIGTYGCVLGMADVLGRIPTEDDFFKEAQQTKRSLPNALHEVLNGWLKYLVRDAIAVGHEHLLQEVIQNLLILSNSRSAVLSSDVIGRMIQDTQVQNEALDFCGLLRQGETASEVSFEELHSRIEKSTAGDRIAEQGLTMAADPFRGRGTVFGDVRITLADDQELSSQQVWINDLAELRTSARGRGIGEHIKNLDRWHPTSEHQKIVAELQRIGTALLTDNSLFPDPLFRNPKGAKEGSSTDDAPIDAPPVDPEHLIRSIDIHGEATQHAHSAHGLNGVTLTGVLRALFDFEDEELETGAIEEPGDPGGSDPPPGPHPPGKPPTPLPPHPPLPPERARTKLRKDMDEFVRKLAEKEFATKCTVTQLVQAVAYPLAVITNGTRGGWIDATSGQDWTTRVFDTSFCAQYSVGTVGLLDAVRQRCDASGELQAFRTIVGDGTLWAAMLSSVSRTAWTGVNSGIKKAFALRRVLLSQELLASAEAGRMSSLITNIERQSGRSLVLNLARDATAILTELEHYLAVQWDDLIKRQVSCKLAHLPGDALFHPKGGWVFVLEPTGNMDETKLRVYRQNRAGEARVQSGFYLNVTKSANGDARLSNWLKRLSSFGEN